MAKQFSKRWYQRRKKMEEARRIRAKNRRARSNKNEDSGPRVTLIFEQLWKGQDNE